MNLEASIFICFSPNSKEYGPYEISKVKRSTGAICRFEGETTWQLLDVVLDAYDAVPASEAQRQRLRKAGIVFQEGSITRRQARELYRNSPKQMANKEESRKRFRMERLNTIRGKGFSVDDGISDAELDKLAFEEPADNSSLQALQEKIRILAQWGIVVPVPKYFTKQTVNDLESGIVRVYEIKESLPSDLKYDCEIGVLSRMPNELELRGLLLLISKKIFDESWEDTEQATLALLPAIAPNIKISELE